MESNKLYVQMLGSFSLVYDGLPVALERNSGTKATQLLQYLIYRRGENVPRDKLVEILYGNDDISNPQNNLKVNIFRLRRLLKASHLPDGDYIVHQSGMYSWHSDLEVVIDAKVFANKAHDAADFRRSEESRRALLIEAAQLYAGEFLPMIAAEPWVAVESVKYRDMYMTCVRNASAMLESTSDHETALGICNQAVKIYPFDEELHLMRISSLLNMRRFQEALSAYDEASRLFFEELGVSPSQKMLDIYRRITGNVRHSTALIEEVKDNLRRDNKYSGSYYCTYPSFMDGFLFVSRLVERSGQSVFLMLSTLTDVHGVPLELGEKLNEAADDLHNAIYGALRNCDMYTRYSPCQYLMLLVGINRENCDIVAQRVTETFRQNSAVRGVRLHHSFASGLEADIMGDNTTEKRFDDNLWGTGTSPAVQG